MATFNNGESGSSVRAKINAVLQHADGTAGEIVFNDAGADVDFRIESDTNANAFFLDGATGNLGVGTTSPLSKLDVRDTNATILVSNSATRYGYMQWENTGSELRLGTDGAFGIRFDTASGRKMTLDASGNVGIGTTNAAGKLHVASAGNNYIISHNTTGSTSALLMGAESGSTNIYSWTTPGGATGVPLRFTVGASEAMRIDTNGNLGVGTTSPNAASVIDAQSTTKGVRFPNMTTTQKNAMANVAGNVIFDTTLGKLCVNTGSGWQTITSA